jgi:hypothetical protein
VAGYQGREDLSDLFGMTIETDDGYGPVVEAGFDGECSGSWDTCEGRIAEGERIRANGAGGWVHEGCEE